MSIAYGAGVGALRSWAAMSWWQQGAARTSGVPHSIARASASSVAVSQACSARTTSGWVVGLGPGDRGGDEGGVDPELAGEVLVVLARLLALVDAGQVHRQVTRTW